jgi:hypothetical protein
VAGKRADSSSANACIPGELDGDNKGYGAGWGQYRVWGVVSTYDNLCVCHLWAGMGHSSGNMFGGMVEQL